MRIENVDFSQALKQLAQRTGVNLPTRRTSTQETSLYRINEAAALFFSRSLASTDGIAVRRYLKERGLRPDTIDTFHLGLSPGDGHSLKHHLLSQGYPEEALVLAGLLSQSSNGEYQGLFKGRLMFPIWDPQGRLVGFGGRALDDSTPKYLNSRQSPIFDKGRLLYGFHRAQESIKERGAVVVEGYMDTIMAHQNGFSNVVASMGTSLTRHQANLLQSVTREVILALDPDTAGQEATLRSLESSWQVLQRRVVTHSRGTVLFERPMGPTLKVVPLPHGKDPDQVILEDPTEWEGLTTNALPLMEFLFEALSARIDLATAQGKAQMAELLFPLVAATADSFEQDRHFRNLADLLGVSAKTLEASLGRRQPQRHRTAGRTSNATSTPFERLERDPLEEHFLALLLQNPQLAPLASNLRLEHIQRVENREVFTNWMKDSTMEPSDQEIRSHWDYLTNKILPPADAGQKEATLAHCIRRLEERRLRQAKEEESLRFAQINPEDFYQHENEVLQINTEMEVLFRSGSVEPRRCE